MLDVGTSHVELGVDLSGRRFRVHDDHDVSLLRVLSSERLLFWHGETR